jgi:hypothetical protein
MSEITTSAIPVGPPADEPRAGGCAGCRKATGEVSARRVLAWRVAGIVAGAALVALILIGLRLPAGDLDGGQLGGQGDEPAEA